MPIRLTPIPTTCRAAIKSRNADTIAQMETVVAGVTVVGSFRHVSFFASDSRPLPE